MEHHRYFFQKIKTKNGKSDCKIFVKKSQLVKVAGKREKEWIEYLEPGEATGIKLYDVMAILEDFNNYEKNRANAVETWKVYTQFLFSIGAVALYSHAGDYALYVNRRMETLYLRYNKTIQKELATTYEYLGLPYIPKKLCPKRFKQEVRYALAHPDWKTPIGGKILTSEQLCTLLTCDEKQLRLICKVE